MFSINRTGLVALVLAVGTLVACATEAPVDESTEVAPEVTVEPDTIGTAATGSSTSSSGGGFTGCVDSDGNNKYTYGNVKMYSNGVVTTTKYDSCYYETGTGKYRSVEYICYNGSWAQMVSYCTRCASGGSCQQG